MLSNGGFFSASRSFRTRERHYFSVKCQIYTETAAIILRRNFRDENFINGISRTNGNSFFSGPDHEAEIGEQCGDATVQKGSESPDGTDTTPRDHIHSDDSVVNGRCRRSIFL